ncbi:LysE/ArgO family amino acid transporter [Arthrobacter sp. H5]|uniref:LysE/ArgO family amino acid transporter n=1 Tax=Arthrobacter sp. H5 TaxID=1267973 RepID=UPI0004B0B90C|nr:LysE/ArgO family amino acid transporter [Arthrobacter sp. H5]
MMFIQHLVIGFGTGLALIVAIGAQNAFVLRHGLRGHRVAVVVLICALSDAVLIVAGIAGIGRLLDSAPAAVEIIRWAGAAFLLAYGAMATRRVFRPGSLTVEHNQQTTRSAVLTILALTWLNPHVYLDTVLLLGTIANQNGPAGRWWFGAGAVTASLLWFSALGFGARALRRFFARPRSWQILDGAVAFVMIALGAKMALGV